MFLDQIAQQAGVAILKGAGFRFITRSGISVFEHGHLIAVSVLPTDEGKDGYSIRTQPSQELADAIINAMEENDKVQIDIDNAERLEHLNQFAEVSE